MIRPSNRVFALIAVSMYFMILTGCGGGDSSPTQPTPTPTPTPTPAPTPVATSVSVSPSSHTLRSAGATVQLSAAVRDQNNNPMSGQTVNWTSANTAVATVSQAGLVTAVSNGNAQITARAGNASGTASITVAEPVPTRVAITPSSHTLEAIGATVQLEASVRDQNNNGISGQSITWASMDEAVATVSAAGLVTAVSNGMAEIKAQSGNLSSNAAITVSQVPASVSTAVDPDSTTLTDADQTLQLAATVSDANDVAIEDAAVIWSSGDESVATVDEDGLVSPVGSGTTEITATIGEVSDSVTVTVQLPSPDLATLMAIYNATDGMNWTNDDNWLSEEPVNTWHGVTLNDAARVTSLALNEVGMAGEIPAQQLETLDQLVNLDLSGNQLTGAIPAELGQLTNLESLDLSGNELTGSIPSELGQLANLRVLALSDNDLTGDIPEAIGGLPRLTELRLNGNEDLSGTLPESLADLPIGTLWMQGTQICLLPSYEALAWLYDITDRQGAVICEEEGEYGLWEGVAIENGSVNFAVPPEFAVLIGGPELRLSTCATDDVLFGFLLPGSSGLKDANIRGFGTITVHYAVWQRRDDADSPWMNIESTLKAFDVCPYNATQPGEYRLVGEVTLDGETSLVRSENTFFVP